MKKNYSVIILLIALLGILVSCSYNLDLDKYKVTYNYNYGSTPTEITADILKGSAALPLYAQRTGYGLDGWYTDAGCTEKYDFSIILDKDITLYAKWIPGVYTVTYKDVGGTSFSGTFTSDYPTTYTYSTNTDLVNPEKDGYGFAGWYTDKECTTPISVIESGTTGDITLYAKWGKWLTFSSDAQFKLSAESNGWPGTMQYATSDPAVSDSWITWDGNDYITSGNDNKIYLRGDGMTSLTGEDSSWTHFALEPTEGHLVDCFGNIMSLLDYDDTDNVVMGDYAFAFLFQNCSCIRTAPELPATTLSDYCYYLMFQNCKALTDAPALPAENLATGCYKQMFEGCSALKTAPTLPATTLTESCYSDMFRSCTTLTDAPELPAVNLAKECYSNMFYGCKALTNVPELPAATTLADGCYSFMFCSCDALKITTDSSQAGAIKVFTCPSTATSSHVNYMFGYNKGSFTGNTPTADTTYYRY